MRQFQRGAAFDFRFAGGAGKMQLAADQTVQVAAGFDLLIGRTKRGNITQSAHAQSVDGRVQIERVNRSSAFGSRGREYSVHADAAAAAPHQKLVDGNRAAQRKLQRGRKPRHINGNQRIKGNHAPAIQARLHADFVQNQRVRRAAIGEIAARKIGARVKYSGELRRFCWRALQVLKKFLQPCRVEFFRQKLAVQTEAIALRAAQQSVAGDFGFLAFKHFKARYLK